MIMSTAELITRRQNSSLLSIAYSALCAVIYVDYEGPLARIPLARSLSVKEIMTYHCITRS